MNPVVHFDIPATNPAKSSKFYQDLFGWNMTEVPQMKYWLIKTTEVDQHTQRPTTPGAINGGMGKRSDAGDIKQAYFTVEVEDIEATLAKVTKAGGQVIREKIDMGQTGQMAVFADFDGNIIGLYHR